MSTTRTTEGSHLTTFHISPEVMADWCQIIGRMVLRGDGEHTFAPPPGLEEETDTTLVPTSHAPAACSSHDDSTPSKPAQTPASSFPRFGDLPPEIRHMIWRAALPARVVAPSIVSVRQLPSPTWRDGGRCPNGRGHRVPGLQAPAVAHACREARAVCARATRPVNVGSAGGEEDAAGRTLAFHPASDTLHVNWHLASLATRVAGPARRDDALAVAADPAVSVLVDAFGFALQPRAGPAALPIKAVVGMVYHRLLRPRGRVLLFRRRYHLCLGAAGAAGVVAQGLFAGAGESRMVPVDDVGALRRYLSWYWAAGPLETEARLAALRLRPRYRCSAGGEHEVSRATLFKLRVADFLLESHGLGEREGWRVVGWDGELRTEHPLVARLDIRLPGVTEVVVFELCAPSDPRHPMRTGRGLQRPTR